MAFTPLDRWSRCAAVALLTVVALIAAGCTNNYAIPIGSFKASVDHGSDAVSTYFTELNSFEREVYLDDLAHHEKLEVGTAELVDGKRVSTPLVGQTFSAKSIEARVQAIRLLGLYAQGLSDLAGSTAPADFTGSAKKFGDQLATTFTDLKVVDATAAKYIGPISAIAGEIGRNFIEGQRDQMLKDSISNGAPQVRAVLDQLTDDLTSIVKPLRDTGTDQLVDNAIKEYNNNRTNWDLAKRQAALAQIATLYDRYEVSLAADPAKFTRDMRVAFDKLVAYCQSDHKPKDLPSLMQYLQSLEAEAKRLYAAAQEIRDIRKGK